MFSSIKIAAFFFFVGIILLPVPAEAQCSKTWDASGVWEIRQGKGGKRVIRLDLKQSGSGLSGKASRDGMTGDVVGDTGGDDFSIAITWEGFDEMNVYRAQVSATGKLSGETYIGPEKRSRDTWYSDQPLTCGWSPGKSRGNLTGRPSANDTAKPGQGVGSRLAAPVLVATQAYFPSPYNVVGQAILQWDAGSAYPNAEVWVKYGGSRERVLFVKQSKGGQQIEVVRGQVYTYALMDGRTVLATAVVVGQ
ncbi:MAG: hypothetical protein IPI64_06140 [Chloracidobacterium sp.]|nr:hypothetical protein [Chloracidobacterium sp.]